MFETEKTWGRGGGFEIKKGKRSMACLSLFLSFWCRGLK